VKEKKDPMNPKLTNEIAFINKIDPTQSSLALDKSGALIEEKKRSGLRNFFSWVIHIITLTLVPRNKRLDEVTRHILEETKDSNSLPDQEKVILAQAITKLQAIIRVNGGSEGKKVSALLKTLSKVDNLDAVKDLKNTLSPKGIPQSIPSTDKRLQNFLNVQIAQGAKGPDFQQALSDLLLQMDGSVDLTLNQEQHLTWALNHIPSAWIQDHIQDISPSLLRFLGEKCLKSDLSPFFQTCFENLIKEPLDKVRLHALIQSLPTFDHKADTLSIPGGIRSNYNKLLDRLTSENIQFLEKNLDTPHLDHFIKSFFGFTAKTFNVLDGSRYNKILSLAKDFKLNNQSKIWPQLYQGQREASFLAKIVAASAKEDQIFDKLLTEEKISEPLTKQVLDNLFVPASDFPLLEKFAPSVFLLGSKDLKNQLFSKMNSSEILSQLEIIPEELLEPLDAFRLNLIAKEMHSRISSVSVSSLKKLAKIIEVQKNALESVDSCPALIHHISPQNQALLLRERLQKEPLHAWNKKEFFEEAKKLDVSIWQEAGVNLIEKRSTDHEIKALAERIKNLPLELEHLATLLNQTDKALFVQEFLSLDIFHLLKPEKLQSVKFHLLSIEQWKSFLEKIDPSNQNARDCLRIATQELLEFAPSYFYALSDAHLRALALENYSPLIQIAIICALDQLNDVAVSDTLDKSIEMLKLTDKRRYSYLINLLAHESNPQKEALGNFINWLVDQKPELGEHIFYMLSLNSFKDEKSRYALVKSLSSTALIKLSQISQFPKFSYSILYQIIELLPPANALQSILTVWESIKEDAYDMSKSQTPHALLISILNDPQKLKELLTGPFHPNYLNQIVNREGYLGPIFEQLEKTPWKLQAILSADSYSPALNRWLLNNKGKYPTCELIVQEYESKKWTDAQGKATVEKLEKLFALAENDEYHKALEIYETLPENTKEYLLKNTRQTQGEALFSDLGRLNKGLLLVAMMDERSRRNIQQTLKSTFDHEIGKNDSAWTTLKGVLQFVNNLSKTSDFHGIAQQFLEPFEFVNTHVVFKNLYNNPQFSDVTLKLGNETFNGHRLILNTIPELQPYLKGSDSIAIPDGQIEKVKDLLLKAYQMQQYSPLNQFLEKPTNDKPLARLFNLDHSMDHGFEQPDFTFKSSSQTLSAHKIILYCSDLTYFKTLLSFDFNETQTNELIIQQEDFEAFKQLLEDVYTGTQRSFEIKESKQPENESEESDLSSHEPASQSEDPIKAINWDVYYSILKYYKAESE